MVLPPRGQFSAQQLDQQQTFLRDLDASLLTRTHVSAGYLAAYYDMRRTLGSVSGRISARRDELHYLEAPVAVPLPDFEQARPETPHLPRTPADT